MDKQKIKSVPRLTTDNPVDNFQTALNFTDVSEDGWVWQQHRSGLQRYGTLRKPDRSPLRRPKAEH